MSLLLFFIYLLLCVPRIISKQESVFQRAFTSITQYRRCFMNWVVDGIAQMKLNIFYIDSIHQFMPKEKQKILSIKFVNASIHCHNWISSVFEQTWPRLQCQLKNQTKRTTLCGWRGCSTYSLGLLGSQMRQFRLFTLICSNENESHRSGQFCLKNHDLAHAFSAFNQHVSESLRQLSFLASQWQMYVPVAVSKFCEILFKNSPLRAYLPFVFIVTMLFFITSMAEGMLSWSKFCEANKYSFM